MKQVTLFVALNHTLTAQQIEGFKKQFGNGQECQIITLASVNAELAAETANINPMATLENVQLIAANIVNAAHNTGATHFVCAGEQTLALWANLFARGYAVMVGVKNEVFIIPNGTGFNCIQSATRRTEKIETHLPSGEVLKEPKKIAVFEHCQWRELF